MSDKTEMKINSSKLRSLGNEILNSSDSSSNIEDLKGQLAAINKSSSVIQFDLDGTILDANANFLDTIGYSIDEIKGKHHRIFCDPAYAGSSEYRNFWESLRRGEVESGEFRRFRKDGAEIWLQATYNPVLDGSGKPYKVIKFATDISIQKSINVDYEAQIAAIAVSQGVVELGLDGIIKNANEVFLSLLGYSLDEVRGKHHRIFCESHYASSNDYQLFWQKLNRGEYDSAEYKRIGKGGKEVWIQASYNPIRDANGKPYKVVKFATDVTAQKLKNSDYEAQIADVAQCQGVIELGLDGVVKNANEKFLSSMGYRLNEVKGKHHRTFCESHYANSREYQLFWEKLNRGEYETGEYKRISKTGSDVWITASYYPIRDLNGKPIKVIKYATDITAQKLKDAQLVKTLSETSSQLGAASSELSATAEQLLANSKKTSDQSSQAAAATEEVTKGIQTVATNTQDMSASIKEISKNTVVGSEKTKESMKKAQETNGLVTELGEESKKIGTVIKTISSIAQQTNLLALNATIEAARAGDAGKGFAVVANEVKELAKQTAKATEEISNKINTIQTSTTKAVSAIGEISRAVEEVNAISLVIASSVEEQTATTSEVSRVVTESSNAVRAVSVTIKDVSESANQNALGAGQLLEAAKGLTQLAVTLKDLVAKLEKK
jgi:methyl-accepting chemotaxis protein